MFASRPRYTLGLLIASCAGALAACGGGPDGGTTTASAGGSSSTSSGGGDGGSSGHGGTGTTSGSDTGTTSGSGTGTGGTGNSSSGTTTACADADGDKHGDGCADGPDCDDTNPAIYDIAPLYTDADGDGYTLEPPGSPVSTCTGATVPAGHTKTSQGWDCDDTDPQLTTKCPSRLVKDINPVPGPNPGSAPHAITATGSGAYFAAHDARNGTELWYSDLTAAGTRLVVDLNPGPADADPRFIRTFGESAYFLANTPELGDELWTTDGTAAGTKLLLDLEPGPGGISISEAVMVGNRLYFVESAGGKPPKLWQSDGTTASTIQVPLIFYTNPRSLTVLNNTLFLLVDFGGGQYVIKVDSTGPHPVYPVSGSLPIRGLTKIGSYVYYIVSDLNVRRANETSDSAVWATSSMLPTPPTNCWQVVQGRIDHLVAAPQGQVALDLHSYECSTGIGCPNVTCAGQDSWLAGTPGGALQPMAGYPSVNTDYSYEDRTTRVVSTTDALYFVEWTCPWGSGPCDGSGQGELVGYKTLWKYDGTTTQSLRRILGAAMFDMLTPTSAGIYWVGPAGVSVQSPIGAQGDALWLNGAPTSVTKANGYSGIRPAATVVGGFYLLSDGGLDLMVAGATTPVGLVHPLQGDAANFVALAPTVPLNTVALFAADDGTTGPELWITRGHASDTKLVTDIATDPGSSTPAGFTELGGAVLFTANDGTTGNELWRSDGTAAGTTQVMDIWSGNESSAPGSLSAIDGVVYFSADDGYSGTELWASRGVTGDPVRIADIYGGLYSTPNGPLPNPSNPGPFVGMGGHVYFPATDGPAGDVELYGYAGNGSPGPVSQVKAINPDAATGSYPHALTVVGSKLFFIADDGTAGQQLWVSDGTAGATVMLRQASHPVDALENRTLVAVGPQVFFAAVDSVKGAELWVSDGTLAGTVLADDINPSGDSSPDNFAVLGNTLYFAATDSGGDRELWMKTGSSPAQRVADINPTGSSSPALLVAAGDRLFFVADDGTHGREPCVTQGSSASTLCFDILPGVRGADVSSMVAVAPGRVVLAASDGSSGVELWQSNGTVAGTTLVDDIVPGPSSSNPTALVFSPALERVFFQADDGSGGVELRTISLPSLGP